MKVSRSSLRSFALWTVLILLFAGEGTVAAQSDSLEYRVKAAFLYNFTKFVDWPDASLPDGSPLTICVVGADPFGQALDSTLNGKTTNDHDLRARRISDSEELADCRVLFIGYEEMLRLRHWIELVGDRPVLTVGEVPRFAELGGMIQFVIVDGKVRFDINHEATRRAGLHMSSRLLSLARTVIR